VLPPTMSAAFTTYLVGTLPVATDIISSAFLVQALLLTTQRDLLVLIGIALFALFLFFEQLFITLFAQTDVISPIVERVILQFVSLPKMALGFVLLRLVSLIATELLDTSAMRWNDALVALFLVFSLFFLTIEKGKPPINADTKPAS
jgi:hypothetical protein